MYHRMIEINRKLVLTILIASGPFIKVFSQTLQAVTTQGNSTSNSITVMTKDGFSFDSDPINANIKVHYLRPSPVDGTTLRFDCTSSDIRSGWEFYNSNEGKSLLYLRQASGFVGIGTEGTPTTTYSPRLSVNGDVLGKKTRLTLNNWADFVFDSSYHLMPLDMVEGFVKENGHLPAIPTEKEIRADEQELGEIQTKLLQKIEELTLYLIEQEKVLAEQEQTIKRNKILLEAREKRITAMENRAGN
jgi:hypothetical protein